MSDPTSFHSADGPGLPNGDQEQAGAPFFRLVVTAGLLGDVLAGLAILEHHVWPGLVLHVLAILLWIAGLARAGGSAAASRGVNPDGAHRGEVVTAFVLGLVLYPGLGPLAATCAFCLAHIFGRPRPFEADRPEEWQAADLLSEIDPTSRSRLDPLIELDVQPLVEVLRKPDAVAKRAALELLCRQPGPRSISLARRLLADPQADVRVLAAAAVSRLEARGAEQLREALARRDRQPQVADHYAAIGHLYQQYAGEGASRSADRHFYLVQARSVLAQAAALAPARGDIRRSFGEVLAQLGETERAWEAVDKLIADRTNDSGTYLLAMELALRQRRFDRLAALAEKAGTVLDEDDPVRPMMKWWAEAQPSSRISGS